MSTKHGSWTVIFPDKKIYKKSGSDASVDSPIVEQINDDAFWSQSKFNGINAIQFTNDATDNDQVETSTANIAYDAGTLGSFQQFVDKFDSAHLSTLQSNWDNDNVADETSEQKISRLGARPTSYTSDSII